MSRQVTIETPFPSLAETAHTLGVSPAEAERVQRMLSERGPRRRARANGHRATLKYAARKQKRADRYSVFLNIPYDSAFENLYLAYIAGLSAFGLIPRATLEIPTSRRRLERILKLLQQCAYSIHDLSRIQADAKAHRVPRFNMPFELGLAVAQDAGNRRQTWSVCETVPYRINKSLSDLNGTDVRIHDGTVRGVFGALCEIFRA